MAMRLTVRCFWYCYLLLAYCNAKRPKRECREALMTSKSCQRRVSKGSLGPFGFSISWKIKCVFFRIIHTFRYFIKSNDRCNKCDTGILYLIEGLLIVWFCLWCLYCFVKLKMLYKNCNFQIYYVYLQYNIKHHAMECGDILESKINRSDYKILVVDDGRSKYRRFRQRAWW